MAKNPKMDEYTENTAEFAQPILKKLRKAFHKGCPKRIKAASVADLPSEAVIAKYVRQAAQLEVHEEVNGGRGAPRHLPLFS